MTEKRNDLSRTEWLIMNICWKKGQVSARVIYEETLKEKKKGYQTVKTMLDRLVTKGYLDREKFGPIWLYNPAVLRPKVISREIETFVSTVLDNTFTPIFAHLAEKEKLSREEIEALKKLVKEHAGGVYPLFTADGDQSKCDIGQHIVQASHPFLRSRALVSTCFNMQ